MPQPVVLSGLSGWLPSRTVDNTDVLARLPEGLTEEWIVQRTGIRERRRVEPGMSTSDMAVRAAAPLVASTTGRIDAVVVATTTPDFPIPATAPIVAAELGLVDAAAWDVNAACSGFVTGLAAVTSMISAGVFGRALLIGADAMSTVVDPGDRNTAILFGDGAGAVLLEADSGAGPAPSVPSTWAATAAAHGWSASTPVAHASAHGPARPSWPTATTTCAWPDRSCSPTPSGG